MPNPWAKFMVSVVITMTTILTGCSTGRPSTPSTSIATSTPCGAACSNQEVTATHCDVNAVDAISAVHEVVGDVHGALSLRKANPSICDHIYWTRFTPDPDSTGNFTLTTWINDVSSRQQDSELENPALAAWTVGVYDGKSGDTLHACLYANGGRPVCLTTTVV